MNELTDSEPADRLERWFRKYSVTLLLGVLIMLGMGVVAYYWQKSREAELMRASTEYTKLVDAAVHQSHPVALDALAKLIAKYANTPYAGLAALQLANQAVDQHRLEEARDRLLWVIEHSKDATLRAVARARLARVLLAMHEAEHALSILDKNDNQAYQPLMLEEKGDIFSQLGNAPEALSNYLAAQKLYADNAMVPPLLVMKINDLTGASSGA